MCVRVCVYKCGCVRTGVRTCIRFAGARMYRFFHTTSYTSHILFYSISQLLTNRGPHDHGLTNFLKNMKSSVHYWRPKHRKLSAHIFQVSHSPIGSLQFYSFMSTTHFHIHGYSHISVHPLSTFHFQAIKGRIPEKEYQHLFQSFQKAL